MKCVKCNSKNTNWYGYEYLCFDCGIVQPVQYYTELDGEIECPRPHNRITDFKYLNTFRKFVSAISGIETKAISQNLLDECREYLNNNNLSYEHPNILTFLKSKKLCSLYNHVSVIHRKLTGEDQKEIPPTIRDEITSDFYQITNVWSEVKPADRKYLPNYIFLLRKLLQLKGYEQLAEAFTYQPYKTNKKIHEANGIWDAICERPNWSN